MTSACGIYTSPLLKDAYIQRITAQSMSICSCKLVCHFLATDTGEVPEQRSVDYLVQLRHRSSQCILLLPLSILGGMQADKWQGNLVSDGATCAMSKGGTNRHQLAQRGHGVFV